MAMDRILVDPSHPLDSKSQIHIHWVCVSNWVRVSMDLELDPHELEKKNQIPKKLLL